MKREITLGTIVKFKHEELFWSKDSYGIITNGTCFHKDPSDVLDKYGQYWAITDAWGVTFACCDLTDFIVISY